MNVPSRHEAQQRAEQIHGFQHEPDRLEREGIVAHSPEQRQRVYENHRSMLSQYAKSIDIDQDQRTTH